MAGSDRLVLATFCTRRSRQWRRATPTRPAATSSASRPPHTARRTRRRAAAAARGRAGRVVGPHEPLADQHAGSPRCRPPSAGRRRRRRTRRPVGDHERPEGRLVRVVERAVQLGRDVVGQRGRREPDGVRRRVAVEGLEPVPVAVDGDGAQAARQQGRLPGRVQAGPVGRAADADRLGGVVRVDDVPPPHQLLEDVEPGGRGGGGRHADAGVRRRRRASARPEAGGGGARTGPRRPGSCRTPARGPGPGAAPPAGPPTATAAGDGGRHGHRRRRDGRHGGDHHQAGQGVDRVADAGVRAGDDQRRPLGRVDAHPPALAHPPPARPGGDVPAEDHGRRRPPQRQQAVHRPHPPVGRAANATTAGRRPRPTTTGCHTSRTARPTGSAGTKLAARPVRRRILAAMRSTRHQYAATTSPTAKAGPSCGNEWCAKVTSVKAPPPRPGAAGGLYRSRPGDARERRATVRASRRVSRSTSRRPHVEAQVEGRFTARSPPVDQGGTAMWATSRWMRPKRHGSDPDVAIGSRGECGRRPATFDRPRRCPYARPMVAAAVGHDLRRSSASASSSRT